MSDHDIERSASRRELIADFCAGAVVIGISIEDWPKFKALLVNPSRTLAWEVIAGLLVILGIAGEVLFARLGSSKQHDLHIRDQARIAELIGRAEQEATARVTLEQSLANTTLLLEQTRLHALQVQEKLSRRAITRMLSYTESRELVSAITKHKGQKFEMTAGAVNLIPYEQSQFISQLTILLKEAGWIESGQMSFSHLTNPGVRLLYQKGNELPAFELWGRLMHNQIETELIANTGEPDADRLRIIIGPR